MSRLARTVDLDWGRGVTIDGIEFPFHVSEDIDVENDSGVLNVVTLRLFVDGLVTLRTREGKRSTYDATEGEVGIWARRLVREGLLERIPDLTLPEGDA